jgi:hypothetical protein
MSTHDIGTWVELHFYGNIGFLKPVKFKGLTVHDI